MSCLFNSLGYFLKIDSFQIRQIICNYLDNNNKLIDGIETNQILSFENNNYVSNMRNSSTWGGGIEIQAACNIWKLKINVHNIRDNNSIISFIPIDNNFINTIDITWNGGHYEPYLS